MAQSWTIATGLISHNPFVLRVQSQWLLQQWQANQLTTRSRTEISSFSRFHTVFICSQDRYHTNICLRNTPLNCALQPRSKNGSTPIARQIVSQSEPRRVMEEFQTSERFALACRRRHDDIIRSNWQMAPRFSPTRDQLRMRFLELFEHVYFPALHVSQTTAVDCHAVLSALPTCRVK